MSKQSEKTAEEAYEYDPRVEGVSSVISTRTSPPAEPYVEAPTLQIGQEYGTECCNALSGHHPNCPDLQPSAAQAKITARPEARHINQFQPALSSFYYVLYAEFAEYADEVERQLRQVQVELEEARKHLALIVDDAVYSDSLGVEGSGFSVCRWCGGGSSPGKGDFAHNHGCIFEDGKLEEMSAQVWEKAEESLLAQLEDRAESAEQKLAVTTEALQQIVDWCDAYPVGIADGIFAEPDMEEVRMMLGDELLTKVSASNFRHVLKGVRGIASDAILAPHKDAEVQE